MWQFRPKQYYSLQENPSIRNDEKNLSLAFIFIWVQKWMSEHGMMCRHATDMRAASIPCLKDYLEAHSCSSGSFFSSLQSHFCFAILNPSCGPWTKTQQRCFKQIVKSIIGKARRMRKIWRNFEIKIQIKAHYKELRLQTTSVWPTPSRRAPCIADLTAVRGSPCSAERVVLQFSQSMWGKDLRMGYDYYLTSFQNIFHCLKVQQ